MQPVQQGTALKLLEGTESIVPSVITPAQKRAKPKRLARMESCPQVQATFAKIHSSKGFTLQAAHKAFAGVKKPSSR